MKLPPGAALSCAVASGSVVVVLTPLVDALTDRVGRRPLILACALLNLLFDYPLFLLAIRGGTFGSLLMALICNAVFQALYTGTIPSILATRLRYAQIHGISRLVVELGVPNPQAPNLPDISSPPLVALRQSGHLKEAQRPAIRLSLTGHPSCRVTSCDHDRRGRRPLYPRGLCSSTQQAVWCKSRAGGLGLCRHSRH
jgi:hypothetical protein